MRVFLSLAVVFLAWTSVAGAQTVRDPNASFLDVPARREELKEVDSPRLKAALAALRPCPGQTPAPPRGRNAEGRGPYEAMEWAVASAATRYVATGDLAEAHCVLDILDAWASAGALLDYARQESQQTWFNVQWAAASAALSLSVARTTGALDEVKLRTVTDWLVKVAEHHLSQVPDNPEPSETWARNHHAYWRGLMAAGVGVVARNGELFRLGLRTFNAAVAELDDKGTWSLEKTAAAQKLQAHNLALQPLILIAELAARQGVDVYGLKQRGRSINDPLRVLIEAPEPELDRSFKPGGGDLAWAEFYVRRFPESPAKRLLTAPMFNRWLGGGATVYAAPVR
jgi:poly(beta-D-mannuronate) lyase